jgi:hypothetical protein
MSQTFPLDPRVVEDIETPRYEGRYQKLSGAKLRFMCGAVGHNGNDVIHVIDRGSFNGLYSFQITIILLANLEEFQMY